MNFRTSLAALTAAILLPALPALAAFQQYQSFPQPAPGAFGIVGTGLPDGRLLVWNGDEVIVEADAGLEQFDTIASGYTGDPGFVALSPDWQRLVLGAGFSGNLYELDPANPQDFGPGSTVAVQPHFSGDFLNNTLLLLDAGKPDFSGSELVVIDLGGSKRTSSPVVRKSAKYALAKELAVEKPPFSYSTNVYVDRLNQRAYAMDGNTRELRVFDVAALITAFETQSPLDWETDGTLIGAAGDYFTGGVSGVLPSGELVIGGSEGFGLPGGVQLVDPGTGDIVEIIDPLGNQSFYSVIYNAFRGIIVVRAEFGEVFAPEDAFAEMPALGLVGLTALASLLGVLGHKRR
jgi:hypothetical protein